MSSTVTYPLTRNLAEPNYSGGAHILVMPRGRPRQSPMPQINNRIRQERESKGWSLARLSKETRPRIPAQTIQRHETGIAQVDLLQLEIYAIALGIKPEELMHDGMRISADARELLALYDRMTPREREQLVKVAQALFIEPTPLRKAS